MEDFKKIKVNKKDPRYQTIYNQMRERKVLANQTLIEVNIDNWYKNEVKNKNFTDKQITKKIKDKSLFLAFQKLKEMGLPTTKKVVNGWFDEDPLIIYYVFQ